MTYRFCLFLCTLSACTSPTDYSEGFTGTVALDDPRGGECSGSIVRFADSIPDQAALMLTGGHCLGLLAPGVSTRAAVDSRAVQLLNRDGGAAGSIRTTGVLYATMTDTDLAILELDRTYSELDAEFGVLALTLSATSPALDAEIALPSGLLMTEDFCSVEAIVDTVRESDWEWYDLLRYRCAARPGSSGAPLRDTATGEVVGVNGTGNSGGADECRLQSPCEVQADGTTEGLVGAVYGHQVSVLYLCRDTDGSFNPDVAGCPLP